MKKQKSNPDDIEIIYGRNMSLTSEIKLIRDAYFYEVDSSKYIIFYIGEIDFKYTKKDLLEVDNLSTYSLNDIEYEVDIMEIKDNNSIYTIIDLEDKKILDEIIE